MNILESLFSWFTVRRSCGTAVCLLMVTAGHAQVTTTALKITLRGDLCRAEKTIRVVMDGDETTWFPANRETDSKCIWKADRGQETFDPERSHFSLRLGNGRTPCQQGQADEDDEVGTLLFESTCCSSGDARDLTLQPVTVESGGAMPLSYLRRVPPKSSSCIEHGLFTGPGPGEIVDVQLSSEEIILQLGRKEADRNATGLWIDRELIAEAVGNGGRLSLSRDRVINRQFLQRSARPSYQIQQPKMAADAKTLANLERLELTVK